MKKKLCPHCNTAFSTNIIKKHENKCIFNYINLIKLLNFIKNSEGNPKLLSKSKYTLFAKKNNILSGKTLMTMLKIPNWNKTLVFLILKFYEFGYIEDLEEFDIIIYKLSYKTMLYDTITLTGLHDKIFKQELESCGFSIFEIDYSTQYENLYAAIIIRAVRDLICTAFQDLSELSEDDKYDAYLFLEEETPTLLKKLLSLHPEVKRYAPIL